MRMLMIGVDVIVWMSVARTVMMNVLVFVKNDFEPTAKYVGEPTQCSQIGNVTAAFQARNHGFCHANPPGQMCLRLTCVAPQLHQLARTLRGDTLGIVGAAFGAKALHHGLLAKLLRGHSKNAKQVQI